MNFFRSLRRRKLRSAFTIFGIGVGISLMVALMTLADDIVGQIRGIYSSSRADLIVTQAAHELDSRILLQEEGRDILAELESVPNVRKAMPMVWSYIRTERSVGSASQINFFGITSDFTTLSGFEPVQLAEPDIPLIDDNDPNGFIVGEALFEMANRVLPPDKQLKVGKRVPVHRLLLQELAVYFQREGEKPFEAMSQSEQMSLLSSRLKEANINRMRALQLKDAYIRGTFRSQVRINEFAIYFPLQTAQALVDMDDTASRILLELEDSTPQTRDAAVNHINHHFETLYAERADKVVDRIRELTTMQKIATAISLLAAVAGMLGLFNTMMVAVFERKREIGLLMAVGWSRAKILRRIVVEGLMLTILGAVVGIGLAWGEMWFVIEWLDMAFLQPTLDLNILVFSVGAGLVLGLLASLYPAWRASRLSPIDAIRYE